MILSLQNRLLQLVGFPVPSLKSFLDRVLDPKGLFTWARLIGLVSDISPYLYIIRKWFSLCSYKWAGWLALASARELGFSNPNLGKRVGHFAIWTRQLGYRHESGTNSSNEFCMVLLCLFYFPHHKHLIWQQWYSYKSCQSYNRRESYNFVFRHVCFVSRISSPDSSSAFSHLGNWAETFPMNPLERRSR